jgi:hypothetical protein
MFTARLLIMLAPLGLVASCVSATPDGAFNPTGGAPDSAGETGNPAGAFSEGGRGASAGDASDVKTAGQGPVGGDASAGAGTSAAGGDGGSGPEACGEQPCLHGTCLAEGDGFQCECESGYSGPTCEIDDDDCAAQPCENGGTCLDGVAAFTCDCSTAPGWGGPLCATNIDDCSAAPCLNGGVCADLTSGFSCDCTGTGFDGTYCEHNVDDCAAAPCVHGTCSDLVKAYECACVTGWEGTKCDVDHNDCQPNPCLHSGVCTDMLAGYSCNCSATGYSGATCQSDVNECKTNNGGCSLNADCINTPGSRKCQCKAGFAGDGIKCLPTHSGYTVEKLTVADPQCDDVSAQPDHLTDQCYLGGCNAGTGATNMAPVGFPFAYFGVPLGSFSVAEAGYIRPQPVGQHLKPFSYYALAGQTVPNTSAPNGMIAPFWTQNDVPLIDRQITFNTFNSSIRYGVFGTAPSRHLTAEWKDYELKVGTTRPLLTFQVKLFETSNAIEFHYCSLAVGDAANAPYVRGTAAIIGLESMDSLKGFAVAAHEDNVVSTTSYFHLEPIKGGSACAAGFVDCDGDPATGTGGCETDVLNDPNNCGGCAAPACSTAPDGTNTSGSAACSFGSCSVACDAGYGDCNGNAADGCERYLMNDSHNCGTCAYYCLDGWGGSCVSGGC